MDETSEIDPFIQQGERTDPTNSTDPGGDHSWSINIQRHTYDKETFDVAFGRKNAEPQPLLSSVGAKCKDVFACSGSCLINKIFALLPFLTILKHYEWKSWIISDIISGICVGVIHIPQSMGFSLLTALPPIYGLYSTMYPVVIYFIFGTSRHISVGTMAVISLMIGSVVEREAAIYSQSLPDNDNITYMANDGPSNETQDIVLPSINEDLIKFKVDIATSVTLVVGIIQIVMYLLNLGIVAKFMSMSFIGGFMTGAACHIVTSQVPFMLGIPPAKVSGLFRLPKSWFYILSNLSNTNIAELITAVICIVILFVLKEIINEKCKHRLKIPIPAELLVVTLGIIISYLGKIDQRFNMRIIANIPTGVPYPKVPTLYKAPTYIADSVAIAIVSYAISMSLAKSFAQSFKYKIDQNQEMLAYGLMHAISSFFSCFGGAQAPPRTLVHVNTGGKTQLGSLVSALMVLMVCLFMGPLIEPLPNSVLAAIIAVALFPLFKNFLNLPGYLRINPSDFVIWVVTFLTVVLVNVDIGLYLGIAVSLCTLVYQTVNLKALYLAQSGETELYASASEYKSLHQSPNIYIFRFESPLYFANVDTFKAKTQACLQHFTANDSLELKANGTEEKHMKKERGLILDCSMMFYIDIMGLAALKQLRGQCADREIPLLFACCSESLYDKMEEDGIQTLGLIYPSVHDAVVYLKV